MIPIKTVRFIIILLGFIVVFLRICIAGTWIDDFSDRILRDWGGGQTDDVVSAAVVRGHFNYRGKKQGAVYSIRNWGLGEIEDFSLELKFMVRNIRGPEDSYWWVKYMSFNEETRKYEGLIEFMFWHSTAEPNVSIVSIERYVLEDHPEFGQLLHGNSAAMGRFAYENGVWYTLRIEREGNQFTFSIGDFSLFTEDNSVPMGWIGLVFHRRCNIWLDDFTVTGPDVPDGGPGFWAVNRLGEKLSTTWGKLKSQN